MKKGPRSVGAEYLKYTTLGVQLVVYLLAAVGAGQWLDGYFNLKTPWCTIGLALSAVLSIVVFIVYKFGKPDNPGDDSGK